MARPMLSLLLFGTALAACVGLPPPPSGTGGMGGSAGGMGGSAGVGAGGGSGGSGGGATPQCAENDECAVGDFCVRGQCTPPLLAEVSFNSDPLLEDELFRVFATVTNPTETEIVSAVEVEMLVPQGVVQLFALDGFSAGGTCIGPSCTPGETVTWTVGDLAPGESRLVWAKPMVAVDTIGESISFLVSATSTNAKSANAQGSVEVVSARTLDLQVVASANPVAAGASMRYTLHYGNRSAVDNAQLKLVTPANVTITDSGGGNVADGEITWTLGRLGSGEGGTRQAVVTVSAAPGEQVGTEAVIVDLDDLAEETRAAAQTPVGAGPLIAFVEMNPDPSRQGELTNVSITVSNPSTGTTRSDVNVEIGVPQGVTAITSDRVSAGYTCRSSSVCFSGQNINWMLGDLGPGESRVVSLEPIIAMTGIEDGALILFEADVRENAATKSSAVEQTTVLASGAMLVQGGRALNLRVVESANPIAPGAASVTYTVHYANQEGNPVIDNAQLRLITPTGSTVTDPDGGAVSDGEVTWSLGRLNPGESGTPREVVATINALAGEQVRAEAVIVDLADPAQETRAIVQTPVSAENLATTVSANADPVEPGDFVRITVTVENTSTATSEGPILLYLQVPEGIQPVPNSSISGGGACISGLSCFPGGTIRWDVSNLAPGESTGLDLRIDAVVASNTPPGSLIFFESQTLVDATDLEQRVVAGTTIVVEPAP